MIDLGFLTFKSLFDFPKEYKEEQLVFYFHSIRYLLNIYRIKEILRKKMYTTPKNLFYTVSNHQLHNHHTKTPFPIEPRLRLFLIGGVIIG